jgi:hypothetical protein
MGLPHLPKTGGRNRTKETKAMKKGIFTLVVAVALLPAGSAWGQTRSFRATIPFPFSVGQQTFPAGNYQFQTLLGKPAPKSALGMIAIRDLDGRHVYKVVLTSLVSSPAETCSQSKLVFGTHSGRIYLSRIWTAGDSLGQQFPKRETGVAVAVEQKEVILADLR